MQEMADAEKERKKADKKVEEEGFNLAESFAQLAAQALASSSSMKELTDNLVRAAGQWLAQIAQAAMPGIAGTILGGGIQFLSNMLLAQNKPLPVYNDAVNTRIVNWDEAHMQFGVIRDQSERAFSRMYREEWAAAARGG